MRLGQEDTHWRVQNERGLLREAHERLRGIVFEEQDPETWVTEANWAEKT